MTFLPNLGERLALPIAGLTPAEVEATRGAYLAGADPLELREKKWVDKTRAIGEERSAMDELSHLYCSVCAWEASQQHFIAKGRGQTPPQFVAVSSGEVQERAPGV